MSQKSHIKWSIEALHDFEDYIDWYLQNASVDVAQDFVEVINDGLDTIAENNYISRMVDEIPELREYIVQRYPFIISYWIKDSSNILVTAFLHQKMKK